MDRLKVIEGFIKGIDPNIEVGTDDRFCVDIDGEVVYITNSLSSEEDEIWSKFLKEEFKIDYNPYVMSILHEVGHIMTFTEDLGEEREMIYFLLQMKYVDGNFEDFNNEYFKIPMEYEATAWAVDFYRDNKELCDNIAVELNR